MTFTPKRPDFWGSITLAAWISADGNFLNIRASQKGSPPLLELRMIKQKEEGVPVQTKDKEKKGGWVA